MRFTFFRSVGQADQVRGELYAQVGTRAHCPPADRSPTEGRSCWKGIAWDHLQRQLLRRGGFLGERDEWQANGDGGGT